MTGLKTVSYRVHNESRFFTVTDHMNFRYDTLQFFSQFCIGSKGKCGYYSISFDRASFTFFIDQRQTFIGHGGVPDMTWSFSYFYWGVHRYWDIRDRTNGQWQVDFDAVSSWTHFVVIYDVWALLLYVDGAPLDSVWVTTPLEHGATQMLHIGELGWAFEGAIDDIRIYDRALSESEISDLFREARGSRSL